MVVKKKKKESITPEPEQRRWPRLKPSAVPFLKSVSFSQGSEVQVIDISRGGILLESEVRLRPQMKIHLKMQTTDGLIKLEGSVLRSSISSLQGTPRYRSAIAFEHPFHMLDDLSEEPAEAVEEIAAEPAPAAHAALESETALAAAPMIGQFDEDSASMTIAMDFPGSALIEMFKRNDW